MMLTILWYVVRNIHDCCTYRGPNQTRYEYQHLCVLPEKGLTMYIYVSRPSALFLRSNLLLDVITGALTLYYSQGITEFNKSEHLHGVLTYQVRSKRSTLNFQAPWYTRSYQVLLYFGGGGCSLIKDRPLSYSVSAGTRTPDFFCSFIKDRPLSYSVSAD